jgi:DNA-binding SARP family transcriptional activator
MDQYEQLNDALHQVWQLQPDSAYNRQLLAAARELYSAFQKAIDEAESLRQAHQQAVEREYSLEQTLQALLGKAFSPAHPLANSEAITPHSLTIRCLGAFHVFYRDRLITDWNGLKGLAVLKYLVSQRGRPVNKDVLMEAIWPESGPETARRNLHQAVYSLRQTLRSNDATFQHIEFYNDYYRINSELDLWIDFVAFEQLAQEGQQLMAAGRMEAAAQSYARAEALYQGDFFEGDLYEAWTAPQREQLRRLYLDITSWRLEQLVERKEFAAASLLAQKLLAQDSCHEQAHRCLMMVYAAQGQRHLAVRQYLACVQLLRTELDLTPSAETTALYRQIVESA